MPATKLAETTFESPIVREYSALPNAVPCGTHRSTLTLYKTGPAQFCVEWDIPTLDDGASIGIWTDETKKVVDYDGVFSLPREVAAFLTAQGFDVSEVVA